MITTSLEMAISRNASRILIWCISPHTLHIMSFVVVQTLARLAASVATSHSHCWFVAGHLNMRKDVIISIWGHGAEIARVIFDKIEAIAQKQDRALEIWTFDRAGR